MHSYTYLRSFIIILTTVINVYKQKWCANGKAASSAGSASLPVYPRNHTSAPAFYIPSSSLPAGYCLRDAVYLRTFQLPHPLSSEIRPWHLSHLFVCSTFWWTSLPFFSEATVCRHDLTLQFKPAPMLTQSEAATHHKPLRSDLYDVLTTLRGFGSIWFKGK